MNLKDHKLNPTQLQQKITYLRAKLTKLETQIVDCENKYQSQLRLLKLENIKLIEEKEHISLQLKINDEKYEDMIENLRGQLPFYYDQENKLNYPLLNQNQKIEKLTKQNTELQETNSTLKLNLEDYNTKMKSMKKEFHSLDAQLTQKQTEVENLQKKNNDLLTQNHQKIEKINEYQSMNESITVKIEKLNKEIQTYENRIKEMEKFSNELQNKNSQLDTYIQKVEHERQSDKLLQKEQNEEINSLQNNIQFLINSKDQLEKQSLELQKEKTNLMLRLEDLEKMDKMRAQSEIDLKQQVNNYLKKVEEGRIDQQHLEKLNDELQKENTTLSSCTDQLNQDLNELKNLNHELNSKVQELQKENTLFTTSIEKLNQELRETQELNHELNSKIQDLRKESEAKASLIDSYNWFQEDMVHVKKNQDGIFTKMEKMHSDMGSFISKLTLLLNEDHEFSILTKLEQQFIEILEDSFVYEEKLDSKLILINELENKLMEITNEIENFMKNEDKSNDSGENADLIQ